MPEIPLKRLSPASSEGVTLQGDRLNLHEAIDAVNSFYMPRTQLLSMVAALEDKLKKTQVPFSLGNGQEKMRKEYMDKGNGEYVKAMPFGSIRHEVRKSGREKVEYHGITSTLMFAPARHDVVASVALAQEQWLTSDYNLTLNLKKEHATTGNTFELGKRLSEKGFDVDAATYAPDFVQVKKNGLLVATMHCPKGMLARLAVHDKGLAKTLADLLVETALLTQNTGSKRG